MHVFHWTLEEIGKLDLVQLKFVVNMLNSYAKKQKRARGKGLSSPRR